MTKQKALKNRIRERMDRTGESYTAARRHVLSAAAAGAPSVDEKGRQEARRARGRAFLAGFLDHVAKDPGFQQAAPLWRDGIPATLESLFAPVVEAGVELNLTWLAKATLQQPGEGDLAQLIQRAAEAMADSEYRRLEAELVGAIQELQALREQPDESKRISGVARQMTVIHTREESLRSLQGLFPALSGRAIPQRLKSPGELALAASFERIQARIDAILQQKLPVRLVHDAGAGADDFPWTIEDARKPHQILSGFFTREEADAYLVEHQLPLAAVVEVRQGADLLLSAGELNDRAVLGAPGTGMGFGKKPVFNVYEMEGEPKFVAIPYSPRQKMPSGAIRGLCAVETDTAEDAIWIAKTAEELAPEFDPDDTP